MLRFGNRELDSYLDREREGREIILFLAILDDLILRRKISYLQKIARRDCIKNIDCTQTLPAYLAREIEFDP